MLPTFQENVDSIKDKITVICESLVQANDSILQALQTCDESKFSKAKSSIKNITSKTDEIDDTIIKILALYNPEAKDLRRVVAYFKITNELSRACSNTRSFIRNFTDVCKDLDSKDINEYTTLMQTSTIKAISTTVEMINIEDGEELQEMYDEILVEEHKVDDLYEMIERELVEQAEASSSFEKYHIMLRALRKSEKITSRTLSVAKLLLYIEMGGSINI